MILGLDTTGRDLKLGLIRKGSSSNPSVQQ